MASLSKEFKNLDLKVDTDPKNWVVIQSQSYKPQRGARLVEEFAKRFPAFAKAYTTEEKIVSLISKSEAVADFYLDFCEKFNAEESVPINYRKVITPSQVIKTNKNLKEHQASLKKEQELKEAAQKEYNDKITKIENEQQKVRNDLCKSDKVLRVLTLSKNKLPLTIINQIETYSPADVESKLEKRQYANELLYKYKLNLLQFIKDDETIDIDSIIDDFATK